MFIKNLIFYQNLNCSLKYQAMRPFEMYKKHIQRPDFTKFFSVILLQPWTTRFTRRYCILPDLSELPISTLPTAPSTLKRTLAFHRGAKTPRSCCLHCQKQGASSSTFVPKLGLFSIQLLYRLTSSLL